MSLENNFDRHYEVLRSIETFGNIYIATNKHLYDGYYFRCDGVYVYFLTSLSADEISKIKLTDIRYIANEKDVYEIYYDEWKYIL